MVIFCIKCGTKNPAQAQFCWRCGDRLPRRPPQPILEEEFVTLEEEEHQFRQLLDRAFELSQRGEVEEAISACQEALKLRPTATMALSLLGSLYERKGERDKAVECYRKAVLLDPNAAAERGRLRQLGEEVPLSEPSPERSKVGLVAAVVSAFLLLGLIVAVTIVGYRYVKTSSRPEGRIEVAGGVSLSESEVVPPPAGTRFPPPSVVPQAPQGYRAMPSEPSERPPGRARVKPPKPRTEAAPMPAAPRAEKVSPERFEFPSAPRWQPYRLPYHYDRFTQDVPRYAPPSYSPPRRVSVPSEGVVTRPSQPPSLPSVPSVRPRAPSPQPRIGVVVEHPKPPPEEVARAEEAEGHRRYLEGEYQTAIAHYKRALSLAKNNLQRAQLLQRLGDAYRDGGDFDSARIQYRNAVEEYREALKEGAFEEARRGIAACKAAMEVIGG